VSELARLQSQFSEALLAAARPDTPPLERAIRKGGTLDAGRRIGIYRSLVRTNHWEALRRTFPACEAVVGEAYFKQLASGYFAADPPGDPDLEEYGNGFPRYLERIVNDRPEARNLPYLPELAKLEWHWARLSREPQPHLLTFEDLAAVDSHRHAALLFGRNPTLRLFEAAYPVHRIWDHALSQGDESIRVDPQSVALALWKCGGERRIRLLESTEAEFLRLMDGRTLDALIADIDRPAAESVPALLRTALRAGWVRAPEG